LRREVGLQPRQTRSLDQCWGEISDCEGGFAVVEINPGNIDDLLRRMSRLERDFPLTKVAVVAPRSLAGYRWLMLEASAALFICSTRQLGPLASAAKRHIESLPEVQKTPEQRIWDSLPWQSG